MNSLEKVLNKGKKAIAIATIIGSGIFGGNYLSAQEAYKNDIADDNKKTFYMGVAQNDTLNFRSSMDLNLDNEVNTSDYDMGRDYLDGNFTPNPEDDRFEARFDANRNGETDEEDLQMLQNHLTHNKFFIPSWYWNKLQTPEERNLYIEQAHAFDTTSEVSPTPGPPIIDCRYFANQTMINFNWITDPIDTANFNKVYPFDYSRVGLENIPLMDIYIREYSVDPSIAHAMNGTFVGDDGSKFMDFNFSEPQFDQMNVQPGEAYMFDENAYLFVRDLPTLGVQGFPGEYEILMGSFSTYEIKNGIPSFIGSNPQGWEEVVFQRDITNPIISTNLEEGKSYQSGSSAIINIEDENFKKAWYSADRGLTKRILSDGTNEVPLPTDAGYHPIYIYAGDNYWNEVLDSMEIGISALGIKKELLGKNFKTYPNPSEGLFKTKFELESFEKIHSEVFDLSGKLIYRNIIESPPGENEIVIDLTNQPDGMYIHRLRTSEDKTREEKIIKR